MILFIQNSRKCKLIYSDKKQISACLGESGGAELDSKMQRQRLQKGMIDF